MAKAKDSLTQGDKLGVQFRSFEIDQRAINDTDRTIEICFATETPAERSFGVEVLDCHPDSVRLDRLNNKGALLFEHDATKQIGAHVPGTARIDGDKKGRALVKFSRSQLGEQEWQDVRDGIRSLVSVGYLVHRYKVEGEGKDKVYRAMDWEPLENSIVSIPVDTACGVGRSITDAISDADELTTPQITNAQERAKESPQQNKMNEQEQKAKEAADQRAKETEAAKVEARKSEQSRIRDIRAVETKFAKYVPNLSEEAQKAIDNDTDSADFQRSVMTKFNPEVVATSSNGADVQRVQVVNEQPQTLGDTLTKSASYKSFAKRENGGFKVDLPGYNVRATLASTGLTSIDKQAGVVMLGQQRVTVADLLAQGTTDATVVRYIRETSFTNASTTVAEGALKPEATFAVGEVDAPVRKIAVVAKITDEMLQDYQQIRSYVDNRLPFMVQTTEEAQLLNGNGAGSNLTGILQTAGILTQAKGADTNADAIFKAWVKIKQNSFLDADGLVLNPADYQLLRLAKDANSQYFGMGPFYSPYGVSPNNGGSLYTAQIWGMPTVVTTAITAGTALVGSFKMAAQVFRKEGIRIETTNSNEDDFKTNKIALRCEERLALAVYLPLGFCTVTGIA